MGDGKWDRAAVAAMLALAALAFALLWALPEDHTTDYLYEPVAETGVAR